MGIVINILLFTICLSVSFWLLTGQGTVLTDMFSCSGTPLAQSGALAANNLTSSSCQAGSLQIPFLSNILNTFGITVTPTLFGVILAAFTLMVANAGIGVILNRFPDPWTWFSIAGIFVFGMATYPISLLNSLTGDNTHPAYFPPQFALMLTLVFTMLYGIAFFWGYKQGGTP